MEVLFNFNKQWDKVLREIMKASPSIIEWHNLLAQEKIKLPKTIINKFISDYNLTGDGGIIAENSKINTFISNNELIENQRAVERYIETAYMIWFLEKHSRTDILEKAKSNFTNGNDDGIGSQFRNFEYECHVAIRFLEEDYTVNLNNTDNSPEFEINNLFTIECKRPTKIEGIFKNVLKAKKQINNYEKPGIVIINIDDLNGIDLNTIENNFKQLRKISNYAFGKSKSYLYAVIFEYVDNLNGTSGAGSYTDALKNNMLIRSGISLGEIKNISSKAINGDDSLKFNKPRLFSCCNYGNEWTKDKTDIDLFNEKIIKRHWHVI